MLQDWREAHEDGTIFEELPDILAAGDCHMQMVNAEGRERERERSYLREVFLEDHPVEVGLLGEGCVVRVDVLRVSQHLVGDLNI